MNQQDTSTEWPVLGPDDPPLDLSREEAAYNREREGLVREHFGKVALIHEDEVVGVFASADEAIREGCRRFGLTRMVARQIGIGEEPAVMPLADITHPSVTRVS
jgi:hypothetical protein